jgi:hypothetical protein
MKPAMRNPAVRRTAAGSGRNTTLRRTSAGSGRDRTVGFWGRPTSSVDWREASCAAEPRVTAAFAMPSAAGVGSALFHAARRPLRPAARALVIAWLWMAAQCAAPTYECRIEPVPVGDVVGAGGSWHPGCPIAPSDLRMLTLSYWGFDDRPHLGRLVVHADVSSQVARVFRILFERRFPIERMGTLEAYGGDDGASMAANNTAGFNCRPSTGNAQRWSEHAYGHAIDVNPLQNPFVGASGVLPAAGAHYLNRSLAAKGLIHDGDVAVRAFESIGWRWGGRWTEPRDYQHFSLSGR